MISAASAVKSLFSKFMKIVHLALLFATALTAVAQSKPNYEIYAIRYATLPDFPVSELVAGAEPERKLDIAMRSVWSGVTAAMSLSTPGSTTIAFSKTGT